MAYDNFVRVDLCEINPTLCETEWYQVNEVDKTQIYTPTLKLAGAKTIVRTRNYGATDTEYFWYNHPANRLEHLQSLKSTIYCSFDFKHFPFDSHYCDLSLGDALVSKKYSVLNSSTISYQGQNLSYLF